MRTAIFQGAFPVGLDLAACFALARAAGFSGVELSLEDDSPLLPEARNETTDAILAIQESVGLRIPRPGGLRLTSTDADIARLRRLADTHGLAIPSVSTMLHFFYPLSSPVPAVRARALHIARRMLEATAQLGGDAVLIVPGMVLRDAPYHEVWRRSQETLASLLPDAERLGVTLAIENVWNKFLLSPLEYRSYIESFGSPRVGAYFDVANVLRYGHPDQWIAWLGSWLTRVHFKDYRLDIDDIRGFTNLLQGDVPWPQVVAALRQIGYSGWVVAEVSPYRSAPDQALFDTAAALNRLLAISQGDLS